MEKVKILIVEDEAIIAMAMESDLHRLGYEVTSKVDTGGEAIKKAKEDKPDIVLMDIVLKDKIDGIEAADIIKTKFGIPVIFSTAFLDEKRIERAKITMPFGYIMKPIRDRDLKVTIEMALYVSKVDSERRKTEDELQEKSKQNQILLDAFPCVALLLRPSTREIVASNKAAVEAGAIPGKQCFSTWGQRKDPCPWCLAPKTWNTNEKQHHQIEAVGIYWDAHWVPISDDLYMHYAFDITERKQVEIELKKFKTITDEASYGAAISDMEGNLQYINNEFAKMHQFTQEELIGKHLTVFHNDEQIPEVTELLKELEKNGSFSSKEVWHKKKDGTVFPTLMNATVINEEGKPKYLSATAIDITEYKKSENNS